MTDNEHAETADDESTADLTTTLTATPSNYKILGKLSEKDAAGVLGQNTSNSGTTYGLRGEVDSTDSSAAGVHGEATDTNGSASGVTGVTQSNGGIFVVAGVEGDAPSTQTSSAWGVAGTSKAEGYYDDNFDTEVFGGGVYGGVTPDSGNYTAGVLGENSGTHNRAAGVRGNAASSGKTFGVYGTAASSDTDAAGVRGDANASSGTVHGVYGSTNSSNGYGLYTPDDAKVDGHVEASEGIRADVGASVYLGSNQTIPDGGVKTLAFDSIEVDERNEFDTGTGKFTTKYAGTYAVDCAISFEDTVDTSQGSETIYIELWGGGTRKAVKEVLSPGGDDGTYNISKTLYNLGANDEIEIIIKNYSSFDQVIYGTNPVWTYMTVRQVA